MKTALLVYPTHANCRETEAEFTSAGLHAATIPARIAADTDGRPANCWNADADRAEAMGLPVLKTVCPACPRRKQCRRTGYLRQLIAAQDADVLLCTHKRAEHSGLAELSAGRRYVSIHENPIQLLRPTVGISEADLVQVQYLLDRMLNDPRFLDWLGDATCVDDLGHRYHSNELEIRKQRQYEFLRFLADFVDRLAADLRRAERTSARDFGERMRCPQGIERTLFHVTRFLRLTFEGQPWPFLLGAAAGALHTTAILVEKRFPKGGQGTAFLHRTAVGVRDNFPSAAATNWFNDATMTVDRLQTILGRAVHDRTPAGHLERLKKAVQIPRDITRGTAAKTVSGVLRGVLVDRPQLQRVGVICHRPHVQVVQELEPEFACRIVKMTYFGSGEERSSNAWHRECDLIVVLGTPRVRPVVIANYLMQIGALRAACEEPPWETVVWSGTTESGEPIEVQGRGYREDQWRRAQRDLVRATLVQAIGRGRGILDTGCEVLVVSTEECGLPLSDAALEPLNDAAVQIWTALRRLTMENPNKHYLGKTIVSTQDVAQATELSPVRTREILRSLERRGLVRKVGERSGWLPVLCDEPAHSTPNVGAANPPSANGNQTTDTQVNKTSFRRTK